MNQLSEDMAVTAESIYDIVDVTTSTYTSKATKEIDIEANLSQSSAYKELTNQNPGNQYANISRGGNTARRISSKKRERKRSWCVKAVWCVPVAYLLSLLAVAIAIATFVYTVRELAEYKGQLGMVMERYDNVCNSSLEELCLTHM